MSYRKFFGWVCASVGALLLSGVPAWCAPSVTTLDVAPVWAAHPVGFCFLTHKDRQFVAYYDDQRQMTVAARKLNDSHWEFVKLPEKLGWDSHNYITMSFDDQDYLHLSGNMHAVPLVYFRSERPMDITSLKRVEKMTGERESKCTYPQFMRGANSEFLFTYRDGVSGNGCQIYNVYDYATRSWKRLLDKPLTDGGGAMNAYFDAPLRGPDGYFHLAWVWRNKGDCSTNHDLSYARSRDFLHWESSTGTLLSLPMTLATAEIVDPVPVKAGLVNGDAVLGFDSQKRPVISYHKYDAQGRSQIFQARLEEGKWHIYQTTDWDYRWDFSGYGTIEFKVKLTRLGVSGKGELKQSYTYPGHDGSWILDEKTLKLKRKDEAISSAPSVLAEYEKVRSDFPGMQVHMVTGGGKSSEPGVRYQLRWEALGSNNDHKRKGPLPAPSMLQVLRVAEK